MTTNQTFINRFLVEIVEIIEVLRGFRGYMKKMKGQIYKAFVNAGFEKEARLLSINKSSIANIKERQAGIRIKERQAGIRIPGSAVGHYIALLDSLPNPEYMDKKNMHIVCSTENARDQAISKIHTFLYLNKTRIPLGFGDKISTKISGAFCHKWGELNEFIKFFNKEN